MFLALSQERQCKGERDKELFLADILAFRCKFKDAAHLYKKCSQEQKALNMYTDLRMFDSAQVGNRLHTVSRIQSFIKEQKYQMLHLMF